MENSLANEKKKLLQEIFSLLEEDKFVSLLPVLRKAVRLANLLDEQEYRFLFQRHIDGWPSGKQPRTSVQKWTSEKAPRWDVLKMAIEDRTGSDGMVQLLSIIEIENIQRGIKEDFDAGNFSEETMYLERGLISIHNRIVARILDFATAVQKGIINTAVSLEEPTSKKEKKHIFVGHGRSRAWRDLKDLLQDRLGLICDEFNREPTAGITTIERLEMMLLAADFAFMVMTGEDEHLDGSLHARENVVHEIGLFQGKLSFRKAIILLEEGCTEFSNIHGLTQIRFPKGNIISTSEEIRRVLEREGILSK